MTRKDYVIIANSISNYLEYAEQFPDGAWRKVAMQEFARQLSEDLYKDNPRFHFGRFLKACGLDYINE